MKHEPAQAALAGADWRKSSYSQGDSDCLEFAWPADAGAVRDSKNAGGQALVFERRAMVAFIRSTKTTTTTS